MLTQLLADARALAAELPIMQDAITAIETDLATPTAIDTAKLAADAETLAMAVGDVETLITAVQADLNQLPQAVGPIEAGVTLTPQQRCRLATLAVFGLEIAMAFGVTIPPQIIQLAQAAQQAACAQPTPTP